MGIFNELQARGLIAQSTNMERVEELLNGDKPVTFYIGFDATADSCLLYTSCSGTALWAPWRGTTPFLS